MARLTNSPSGQFLLVLAAQVCLFASVASAQTATGARLAPKVALAAIGPAGCQIRTTTAPVTSVASTSPRDATDSTRRLIAAGQDAAVQGDHGAARDAFMLAKTLSPTNARVAYYLGREYEELGEIRNASTEYCRYLALVPTAPDADEVRGRVLRLTPPAEIARTDEARAQFRSGVTLLQQRQFVAADSAFGSVIRTLPAASEAFYNRGLTRAARGERAAAMADFERYLQLSPGASDQAAIRSAMARLQDRVWDASSVFLQGLIAPGVGQMATGRPIRGVLILAVGGGIAAAGLTNKSTLQTNEYRDPFGNPYIDSVQVTEHPYLLPAAGALAAVWILSALEASAFARGSLTRARGILAASVDPAAARPGLSFVVRPQPHGRIGVGFNFRGRG
jgi:Flp pilus assembly protein TadD